MKNSIYVRVIKRQRKKENRKKKECSMMQFYKSWIFPSEIVGKRICLKLDGSWLLKIHLEKAQQNQSSVDKKAGTFLLLIYKNFTGKFVNF